MTPFDRVLLAGVGLIGGSLGLALRERSLAHEVIGLGRTEENLAIAQRRGAIDRYALEASDVGKAVDLAVLGVPVRAIGAVAERVLPVLAAHAIVIDVGSVKQPVVQALEGRFGGRARVVGCHPIAGTERAGAANAAGNLFEGALCILTPTSQTDPAALERARELWRAVGMRIEEMGAEEHDRLFASVSHLPHAVAYALLDAVSVERGERDPLAYSGGGLRDSTRIAASPEEMWRDIFLENRKAVLESLDLFEARLRELRRSIEHGDGETLGQELARIRRLRDRVAGDRS